VRVRMGAGPGVHIPDQSLRSVWPAPGLSLSHRTAVHQSEVRNAGTVSARTAPVIRWLAVRILEYADDDARALTLLGCDDGLHPDRDPTGRTRPGARAFRGL